MTKENKKLSIAVMGAGNWGKNLIRNFFELNALKVIGDKDEVSLNQMRKLYPSCDFYSSLTDVLSRDDISGVVIATPAETHFMLARKVLQSGKHVFVEKPLTLSGKDAAELIALAQKKNLVLMVGHLLQYHPAFIKLKQLAQEGELGQDQLYIFSPLKFGKNQKGRKYFMVFRPA